MPVALTLGLPPRAGGGLLTGLLDDASGGGPHPGVVHGVPVRDAAAPAAAGHRSAAPVAVRLDPRHEPGPAGPGVVRRELDVRPADLAAVLAHPDELVVFLEPGRSWHDDLTRVLAAGHRAGLPADLGGGRLAAERAADFLAVLAHADRPFVARAGAVDGVLAVLAATVAALRGSDVRAAWTTPDAAALAALGEDAGAAVREVLASVAVPDPVGVAAALAARGLVP